MNSDSIDLERHTAKIRWDRILIILGIVAVIYILGQYATEMIVQRFDLHMRVRNEPMIHQLIMTAISVYFILMVVPFMPSVEIGLSMILFFGSQICFLVYVTTVAALTLSYTIGRFVPASYCINAFAFVGFTRAERLVRRIAPLDSDERLTYFLQIAPVGIAPFILRHRFLALAVLLNLPGNLVIGGGGGIALLAGMSGLFRFSSYLLTVALAVAPVPLIISFTELGMYG